jgi:hypothetical protein
LKHREELKAKERAYYAMNRKAVLARQAAIRSACPERIREYRRKYQKQHAGEIRRRQRAWYEKNRVRILAKLAAEYAANPEPCIARVAAWRAKNPRRVWLNRAVYRARHREKLRAANLAYFYKHRPDNDLTFFRVLANLEKLVGAAKRVGNSPRASRHSRPIDRSSH